MTTHYLLNITYACQNACSYCWVEQTVRQRPELMAARTRPLADWMAAIQRDRPDVVDIAGGEPMLVSWVPDLIAACPETRFGLSTNGLMLAQVDRLASMRLHNLIGINLSVHPKTFRRLPDYALRFHVAAGTLHEAGYPVLCNVVDHYGMPAAAQGLIAWLAERRIPVVLSPYERTDDLDETLEQGLVCQGGVNHLVVGPDGAAWPCLTTLRSPYWAETRLGNWLDGTVDLSRREQPCHLRCTDFYVLAQEHHAGQMWGTEARPV